MRKIILIGAGQSGLQLGHGLLEKGYDVTIVTDRTAQEVHDGSIMSSQVMFHPCLQTERDLGLNFWDEECPFMKTLSVTGVGPDGSALIDWTCSLGDGPSQSLDQRVKFPVWMNKFEERGGKLIIHEATIEDAEGYAEESDLLLVATGKGALGRLFQRDPSRSPFDKPQRNLLLLFVNGMIPRDDDATGGLSVIPGVGEYLCFRALTTTGECAIMLFEAAMDGPMDDWKSCSTLDEHIDKAKSLLGAFLPWEAERCKNITPTDPNAILRGAFPPTVKTPLATLPSGATSLGIGDAVVLNDPVTGRGANGAAMAASIYLRRILEHTDHDFTPEWMTQTFEDFYDWAQWGVRFTNVQLGVPPAPHIIQILMTAQENEAVKQAFVNGFNNPETTFPWIEDPAETQKFIDQHS
ncbi:MAG: styrene monooxygenase/indole monooxygenase family protein [Candidatus Hydrogenedentota bacterium]